MDILAVFKRNILASKHTPDFYDQNELPASIYVWFLPSYAQKLQHYISNAIDL
jgi:hypothetical protein